MADVMSFNIGHFGWCDREKFRKRCWKILVKHASSKTKCVGRQKGCRHDVLDFMANMYQA